MKKMRSGKQKAIRAGSLILIAGFSLMIFISYITFSFNQTAIDMMCAFPILMVICIGIMILGVSTMANMALLNPSVTLYEDDKDEDKFKKE